MPCTETFVHSIPLCISCHIIFAHIVCMCVRRLCDRYELHSALIISAHSVFKLAAWWEELYTIFLSMFQLQYGICAAYALSVWMVAAVEIFPHNDVEHLSAPQMIWRMFERNGILISIFSACLFHERKMRNSFDEMRIHWGLAEKEGQCGKIKAMRYEYHIS